MQLYMETTSAKIRSEPLVFPLFYQKMKISKLSIMDLSWVKRDCKESDFLNTLFNIILMSCVPPN